MQNERKRILNMLENGTISTDEALTLLEALSKQDNTANGGKAPSSDSSSNETQQSNKTQQENSESAQSSADTSGSEQSGNKNSWNGSSADEFMEDLRKDLTQVGDQFMQFMQSAVQKVKQFDVDKPFGSAVTFDHKELLEGKDIEELDIDIDNGKCSVVPGEDDQMVATFSIKTYTNQTPDDAKKEFLEKLIVEESAQSLRIASSSKTIQVNVTITVPQKKYRKISARLLNGGFDIRNLEADVLRVKTANGKVNMSYMKAREASAETLNGEIRLLGADYRQLSAQTVNGLIYIDGKVKETEARTLNGSISVTTSHEKADKIDVKSVGGNIELYVPSTLSLMGDVKSSIGSINVKLPDVEKTSNQEQLLHRSMMFKKDVQDSPVVLHTFAESKTGSVLVCYRTESNE